MPTITAADLMTSELAACRPSDTCSMAAQAMWDCDCGVVPVIDDHHRVVGILTDRDICMATHFRHATPADLLAGDVMQADVQCCSERSDFSQILAMMRDHRVRRLPVVNERGGLIGMVSISDMALHARNGEHARQVFETLREICRSLEPARPAR